MDDLPGGGGDVPDFQNFEEFQDDRRTAESEEDDDYDDAILPTMDPLSREPIKTAVTNKFCHHVYDLESITGLIRDNSEAKLVLKLIIAIFFQKLNYIFFRK